MRGGEGRYGEWTGGDSDMRPIADAQLRRAVARMPRVVAHGRHAHIKRVNAVAVPAVQQATFSTVLRERVIA